MGLSQRAIAKLLKLDQGHLSKFLAGEAGLSSEMALKVLRLTKLTRKDLALKFGRPEKTTAKIMSLQESGRVIKLDYSGSWVPGLEDAGTDPNDDGTDDEQEFLDEIAGMHQAIVDKITARQDRSVVNAGSTEGTRRVSSDPKAGGGTRGDEYPR